jgi:hypothetical protein
MTKSRKTKPISQKAKKTSARAARPRGPKQPVKSIERLEWQGIVVSVSYEADWLGMSKNFPEGAISHLEIEAVSPERAVLPVTDTGYRSQFLRPGTVEDAGGAVSYARAWLDHAAKAPGWKKKDEQSRQLSLF